MADEYEKENKAVMWRRHTGLNHFPGDGVAGGGRYGTTMEGEKQRLGPYSLILPTEVKSFKWVELQDQ